MRHFPARKPRGQWRGTTGGSTRAWRNQRERVLERDGYQCTHIDQHGQRCTTAAPARLEIDHLQPGQGVKAPDHQLTTVCTRHNPRGPHD